MLQTFLRLMKKINYKGTKYRTEGLTILPEFWFFSHILHLFSVLQVIWGRGGFSCLAHF